MLHDNLNLVYLGTDSTNLSIESLDDEIEDAKRTYLSLVSKRLNYDAFKKRLVNETQISNLLQSFPANITCDNSRYDIFKFNIKNAPLKLYFGHNIKLFPDHPYSSAVYYQSAPIHNFTVTLVQDKIQFEGFGHPHAANNFENICVGHHHFKKTLTHSINDSSQLIGGLMDMFTWLFEVNYHDNYGSNACSPGKVPQDILIYPGLLTDFVFKATDYFINNSSEFPYDLSPEWMPDYLPMFAKRDLAYAMLLYHAMRTDQKSMPSWEYNIITSDIEYYLSSPSVYYPISDPEHLYAPITYSKILSHTKKDHFLCNNN